MITRYLRRGALAGIGGGAALALFLLLVGESSINDAIALEEAAADGGGHEVFSRSVQQVGGAVGSIVIGAVLGAVFGIVFAATRHRLPGANDWRRSLWLAAVAFTCLQLVPALKYPANPPGVGVPDTVGDRTVQFLLLVAFTIVATIAAARLARWLDERGASEPARIAGATLAWLALVGLALALFPPNPDPVDVPAQLVWRFRLASIGGVATFWAMTGAVFGWLQLPVRERGLRRPGTGDAARDRQPTP